MENISEDDKKTLVQKLLGFQKQGLISYGKYLNDQLENTNDSDLKKSYKNYIKDQIELNKNKIHAIDAKL